jgi:hypothetical protein
LGLLTAPPPQPADGAVQGKAPAERPAVSRRGFFALRAR